MILKNQVEWALHCCTILAGIPEGRYVPTAILAEFHGVPKEYLSKAMQTLSQAGIVKTTLGPRGGYRLLKAPNEVTMLEIVEAVEGKKSTFKCQEIRKNNPCRDLNTKDKSICNIARVMYAADQAWRDHLRAVKLSDIVQSVAKEVPAELLEKSRDWILAQT